MKKNNRIGALVDEFTSNPCKLYDSKHFCDKFGIAKSSLSEDIKLVNEVFIDNGTGYIESTSGVGGGIRYVPGISDDNIKRIQDALCTKINDPSRILGGGFLYTSDIMFDGKLVDGMARVFAQKYYSFGADYVVTVETKGIPLAARTASLLNLPLVVIRREAMYSEGSTVSINYFSGSSDRIQKMSIAKRAVEPGSKALIIDDFMRGGGSIKGIVEILAEFDMDVIGVGIAIVASEPVKKRVSNYLSIVCVDEIDEEGRRISVRANDQLTSGTNLEI
ncbi:MAG: pur operon repressor [Clostridiales bacterium]|nr:pur operon repressor [Candidatus Crickella merdequi]